MKLNAMMTAGYLSSKTHLYLFFIPSVHLYTQMFLETTAADIWTFQLKLPASTIN